MAHSGLLEETAYKHNDRHGHERTDHSRRPNDAPPPGVSGRSDEHVTDWPQDCAVQHSPRHAADVADQTGVEKREMGAKTGLTRSATAGGALANGKRQKKANGGNRPIVFFSQK